MADKEKESKLFKDLIAKYPALKEKKLTTGSRLKLTGKDKDAILKILSSDDAKKYEEAISMRRQRKGMATPAAGGTKAKKAAAKKAPTSAEAAAKKKAKMPEREIVEILVKKHPALKKFVTGGRLMVRQDKARQINDILNDADDQALYQEMIEERGKRKFQEGKGIKKPKLDEFEENKRLGQAGKGSFRGKARKQSAPVRNQKTVPQRIARKQLIEKAGKPEFASVKTTIKPANVAQAQTSYQTISTSPPAVKANPGLLMGRRPYLKRNVRAGDKEGAVMNNRGAQLLYG